MDRLKKRRLARHRRECGVALKVGEACPPGWFTYGYTGRRWLGAFCPAIRIYWNGWPEPRGVHGKALEAWRRDHPAQRWTS